MEREWVLQVISTDILLVQVIFTDILFIGLQTRNNSSHC